MVLGSVRLIIMVVADTMRMNRLANRAGNGEVECAAETMKWILPLRLFNTPRYLFSAVSFLFHAGILIVPLFLLEHIILVKRAIGFGWPQLPGIAADVLTLAVIFSGMILIGFRILSPAGRRVSRLSHYLSTALVVVVFATGFLATNAYNPVSYETVMIAHSMLGNLLMAAIPYTRFSHAILFPFARFVTLAGWRFPSIGGKQ
jgi:nitrate reductase gamma subunit